MKIRKFNESNNLTDESILNLIKEYNKQCSSYLFKFREEFIVLDHSFCKLFIKSLKKHNILPKLLELKNNLQDFVDDNKISNTQISIDHYPYGDSSHIMISIYLKPYIDFSTYVDDLIELRFKFSLITNIDIEFGESDIVGQINIIFK